MSSRSMRSVAKTRSKPSAGRPSEVIRARVAQINAGLPINPGPSKVQVSKRMISKRCERKAPKDRIIDLSDTDSNEGKLVIADEESDPTISDSKDSFDSDEEEEVKIEYKGSLKKLKRERVRKWWAKNFDEKRGDSSKIVEITIDDLEEDNDNSYVIQPKVEPNLDLSTESIDKPLDNNLKTKKLIEDQMEADQADQMESFLNDQEHQELLKRYKEHCQKFKSFELSQKSLFNEIDSNFKEKPTNSKTVITQISKPIDKWFCFICPSILKDSELMKTHYINHFEVFIQCGQCGKKFSSLQTFRNHDSRHLDRNNMKNLDEFMNVKKWVDHYIDYIEKHEQLVTDFIPTNRMFCPICYRIRHFYKNVETSDKHWSENTKPVNFDEEFVLDHLHQHFQYFPFECIDCSLEGKMTEFCLSRTARQHLLDVHKNEKAFDMSLTELKIYFDLKKSISFLKIQIDKCLQISTLMRNYWQKSGKKIDKRKIFVAKQLANN